MPRKYAKRSFRKRRGGRSFASRASGYVKSAASAYSLAKSAWKGVKYIKGLVNSEMYHLDTVVTPSTLTDSGSVVHLTALANGDGDGSRTGNSVLVKSLNGRIQITRTSSGDVVQFARFAIVRDNQQIGDNAPALTDIYRSASTISHLNATTLGRYSVLWSKTVRMESLDNFGKSLNFNLPMMSHVRYNGTAATDIQKNGLYLVCVASQATANQPIWIAEIRLAYHDN